MAPVTTTGRGPRTSRSSANEVSSIRVRALGDDDTGYPGVEPLGDLRGQCDEVLHGQVARGDLAEGHGLQLGDLLQLWDGLDELAGTEPWGDPTGCSSAAGVRRRDRAAEGEDRHLGQSSRFIHGVTSLFT
jgi:hypothetical protein